MSAADDRWARAAEARAEWEAAGIEVIDATFEWAVYAERRDDLTPADRRLLDAINARRAAGKALLDARKDAS
jgi:hypothetical protein